MLQVNPEDFAVPLDEVQTSVTEVERTEKHDALGEYLDRSSFLTDYFAVKYKLLHHDVSVFLLYGNLLTIKNSSSPCVQRQNELFTDVFKSFPLAAHYTANWQFHVNTPVLFPGKKKQHKENFSNPVRIINSYLRAQANRFKDTELVLYRDRYNLRPKKAPESKKCKTFRTLYTTHRELFLCKPHEQIVTKCYDSSVLYKKNPRWTTENLHFDSDSDSNANSDAESENPLLSDADFVRKVPQYDSDETFTYWDDNLSVGSATETESELQNVGELDAPDSVDNLQIDTCQSENSQSLSDTSETDEDTAIEVKATTILTESIKVTSKMDIISVTQDTALKRLLEVDVSDLITDEAMKQEIKFFRDLDKDVDNKCTDLSVDTNDERTVNLRHKLRAARKRKAENFRFLSDALDNVKRLKLDCLDSMSHVNKLEKELELAVIPVDVKESKPITKNYLG